MPSITQYTEQVTGYLEYIEYPYIVVYFNPKDVAISVADTIAKFYLVGGVSYRLCAIVI